VPARRDERPLDAADMGMRADRVACRPDGRADSGPSTPDRCTRSPGLRLLRRCLRRRRILRRRRSLRRALCDPWKAGDRPATLRPCLLRVLNESHFRPSIPGMRARGTEELNRLGRPAPRGGSGGGGLRRRHQPVRGRRQGDRVRVTLTAVFIPLAVAPVPARAASLRAPQSTDPPIAPACALR
jgi:hypothetical protein